MTTFRMTTLFVALLWSKLQLWLYSRILTIPGFRSLEGAKMKALHETENQEATQKPQPEIALRARRKTPPPGRPMSFEEALATTMSKYDNALRELAK